MEKWHDFLGKKILILLYPVLQLPIFVIFGRTSFPAECNYVGSVSPKASMILRWMGPVSV